VSSIPDSLIEEVRQRGDLVELVSEHTKLRRSGRTYRGPCPLHGGEGPNFSVDPGKNVFKCFVCGEGGDLFAFPMKMLGMSFLDSVRFIAERVGIPIPEARAEQQVIDPYERHHETNAFAADWFRRQLWEGDEGAEARAYLERRGIGREAAERFELGWAPESWTALGDAARKHGIPNDLLMTLGLVKESTKGGREPYDAFRGRLIFPIKELGGRVVAFGGRVIVPVEDHVPKYLNSPETPVYRKGDVLYGLNWSRGAIRRAESALVVEGYMDYVSLAAAGVENLVAPLGTAMTQHQAELLARYAPRVILLYDSDSAGLKATFRSGDELLRAGAEVLVATLPDGEDPDSLVRAGGAKALQGFLRDAVDVLERKIQILERRDYFRSIAGVRRAIDSLLPTVRAATDEVLRGVYIARISERTGVPRETIEREVAEAPARDTRPAHSPERRRREDGRRAEDAQARGAAAVRADVASERTVIALALLDDGLLEQAAGRLSPDHFRHPLYRAIYEELIQLHAEGAHGPDRGWLDLFPEELLEPLQELLSPEVAESLSPTGQFFEPSLRRILLREYDDRMVELQRQITVARPEEAGPLQDEMTRLQREMAELNLVEIRKHGMLRQAQFTFPIDGS
jgi:DNA primase